MDIIFILIFLIHKLEEMRSKLFVTLEAKISIYHKDYKVLTRLYADYYYNFWNSPHNIF